MHIRRLLVGMSASVLLAGCGGPSAVEVQSTAQAIAQANPVVVTQVVQQTVVVVVTATPLPATATPIATPTLAATPTPDVITAIMKDAVPLLGLPEKGYKTLADLKAGDSVTVKYHIDGWYGIGANGKSGWVPETALTVDEAVAKTVPSFPGPLLVVQGEVVQESLAGSTIFKGTVRNYGTDTASGAVIEIETLDANDQRVDLVDAPVMTLNVAPGATEKFQGISQSDYASYIVRTRCQECQ